MSTKNQKKSASNSTSGNNNNSTPVKSDPSVVKISAYDSAHEYAKDGRTAALLELINEHQDDEKFIDYYHVKSESTMLTISAAEGQIDVVQLLIDNECKIDVVNGKNNTALIEAAIGGYFGILINLLINILNILLYIIYN